MVIYNDYCRLSRCVPSNAHVYAIFAEAAFLAGKAIEAATELQRMPGMPAEAFAETPDFWCSVRDCAATAAQDSAAAAGRCNE
jgi:hypothetical protein